jgi:hypothetical protein
MQSPDPARLLHRLGSKGAVTTRTDKDPTELVEHFLNLFNTICNLNLFVAPRLQIA